MDPEAVATKALARTLARSDRLTNAGRSTFCAYLYRTARSLIAEEGTTRPILANAVDPFDGPLQTPSDRFDRRRIDDDWATILTGGADGADGVVKPPRGGRFRSIVSATLAACVILPLAALIVVAIAVVAIGASSTFGDA